MNTRILISIASTTLLLAACGGRDDPVAAVPTMAEAPASASASAVGLVDYLTELSLGSADTQEQVSLASFMPVTPEDTPPEALK